MRPKFGLLEALTLICALIYLIYTPIDKNYIFLFQFNFVYRYS